ncbi:MAG: hypothetical protein HRU12_22810, partial [Phaeodactylibacter sp.]|nr:hypothetical protein [Phaeodactylibacter sp.]
DDVVTLKLNNEGDIVWQQTIGTNRDDVARDVIINKQGEIVLTGYLDRDLFLWKYNADGESLDSLKYNVYGNSNSGEGLIETDNGYVVTGFTEVEDADLNWLIFKADEDFNIEWSSDNGRPGAFNSALDLVEASPNGYAFAGFAGIDGIFIFYPIVVRSDEQGLIRSNGIEGRVIHDIDESCDVDPGEPSLSGWLVRATNPEGTSFFSITDEEGRYSMTVDSGSYVVDVLIRNDYWESCFPNGVNISFDQLYDTITVDLPVKAVYIDCPLMEVEVSTPYLSNCFDIEYTVNYANGGTGGTNGEAMVEVELDPSLTFIGASLPFTVDDGIYTFDIGEVPYNTEGSFKINTSMDCEGIIEDQSALVTAVIFPDTLCTPVDPDWNGASISVDGVCSDQDEIIFTVDNSSSVSMLTSKTFFIVETDAVVFITQDYNLGPGESASAPLIDPDGKTYRIIAEQVDGHPGSNFPTKAVEGCGTDDEGNYSVGYVTQWPENDADPSVSIHVDEVLG